MQTTDYSVVERAPCLVCSIQRGVCNVECGVGSDCVPVPSGHWRCRVVFGRVTATAGGKVCSSLQHSTSVQHSAVGSTLQCAAYSVHCAVSSIGNVQHCAVGNVSSLYIVCIVLYNV